MEGTTFSLPAAAGFVNADTGNGDVLTYTVTGLPPGLTFDANTGLISGTIPLGASTSGPYTITVTATDSFGRTATDTSVSYTHLRGACDSHRARAHNSCAG